MELDCETCFACCIVEVGLFIVDELKREGQPLSKELKDEAIRIANGRSKNDAAECVWLVKSQTSIDGKACGKCKYYDQRPKVCKDFKVGGADCIKARKLLRQAP